MITNLVGTDAERRDEPARRRGIKCLAATVAEFVADDQSCKKIEFWFRSNLKRGIFGFEDRTDLLTIEARGNDATGTGRTKLLQLNGRSVVSDIDDTIRTTEIRRGLATTLRRTFLEQLVAVPGKQARYGARGNATATPGGAT